MKMATETVQVKKKFEDAEEVKSELKLRSTICNSYTTVCPLV